MTVLRYRDGRPIEVGDAAYWVHDLDGGFPPLVVVDVVTYDLRKVRLPLASVGRWGNASISYMPPSEEWDEVEAIREFIASGD